MTAVIVSNDRPYATKVVLHCLDGYRAELDRMVEDLIVDGVAFVGVVGNGCSQVEDIIDELVVDDGSDDTRFVLTSSHPDESVEEAVEFAKALLLPEYAGDIQIVCLPR